MGTQCHRCGVLTTRTYAFRERIPLWRAAGPGPALTRPILCPFGSGFKCGNGVRYVRAADRPCPGRACASSRIFPFCCLVFAWGANFNPPPSNPPTRYSIKSLAVLCRPSPAAMPPMVFGFPRDQWNGDPSSLCLAPRAAVWIWHRANIAAVSLSPLAARRARSSASAARRLKLFTRGQ